MQKKYVSSYTNHFGIIFSNLAIFSTIVTIAMLTIPLLWNVVSTILFVTVIFFIFAATLFTLGAVWVSKDFRDFSSKVTNTFTNSQSKELLMLAYNYLPYGLGIAFLFSILAIVILNCDKKQQSIKNRLVLNYVLLAILIIITIIYIVTKFI